MPDTVPIADAFPPPDPEAWRRLAGKALRGAPLATLTSTTDDGIAIPPLAAAADAAAAPARPAAPWTVVQRLEHPDPAVAGEQAITDLENGASGLALVFAGAPGARGQGLSPDALTLATVLDGIALDAVSLRLEAGPATTAAVEALAGIAAHRGTAPRRLAAGWDPFAAALSGATPEPAAVASTARALTERLDAAGIAGTAFQADGRPVHEAGGTEAQELAAVLAAAVAYLRLAAAEAEPARRIGFTLAADVDEFATLAKFRALRALWARVLADCGHPPVAAEIHAETSWRMLTRHDPSTNVLRATVAAFAAGVGGADSISVLPHTAALGLPDAAARRLARNVQTVLLEEASLWRVADPGAGSGAIEGLTAAMAERAWDLFRAIEAEGGIARALAGGGFREAVAGARATRLAAVAAKERPIVGTSVYAAGAAGDAVDPAAARAAAEAGLAPFRPAALFEDITEAAE